MINLIKLELYKIIKNPLFYVAIIGIILVAVLGMNGNYSQYEYSKDNIYRAEQSVLENISRMKSLAEQYPDQFPGVTEEQKDEMLEEGTAFYRERLDEIKGTLVIPSSISYIVSNAIMAMPLFVLIITVILLGAEYKNRTIKQILARGVSRKNFLISKMASLAVFFMALVFLYITSAAITSAIFTAEIEGSFSISLLGGGFWADAGIGFLLIMLVICMYQAFAMALTNLTRSTTASMSISLVLFLIVDLIFMNGRPDDGSFLDLIAPFTFGFNAGSIANAQMPVYATSSVTTFHPLPVAIGIVLFYVALFTFFSFYNVENKDLA